MHVFSLFFFSSGEIFAFVDWELYNWFASKTKNKRISISFWVMDFSEWQFENPTAILKNPLLGLRVENDQQHKTVYKPMMFVVFFSIFFESFRLRRILRLCDKISNYMKNLDLTAKVVYLSTNSGTPPYFPCKCGIISWLGFCIPSIYCDFCHILCLLVFEWCYLNFTSNGIASNKNIVRIY